MGGRLPTGCQGGSGPLPWSNPPYMATGLKKNEQLGRDVAEKRRERTGQGFFFCAEGFATVE